MAGYLDSQADWQADLGNGFYKNPILRQDLPEPDLVRVGPWFFLLSARPGLPILHSQDLVNWSLASFVTGEPGRSRFWSRLDRAGWTPALFVTMTARPTLSMPVAGVARKAGWSFSGSARLAAAY